MAKNNVARTRGSGSDKKRISDLKFWREVQLKIRAGERSGVIAKWIHEEAKELLDYKIDSVRRMVARERELMGVGESYPEKKKAREEMEKIRAEVEETKKAEVTDRTKRRKMLDIVEEINNLYEIQMDRVRAGRKVEATMGYLIRTLTSDVAEAREILKFAFEVDREMGISKRPSEEVEGGKRFESLTYEARKRVLQALDMVKSRIKVMEIEERRVDKASEEVVDAEVVRPEGVLDSHPDSQIGSETGSEVPELPFDK